MKKRIAQEKKRKRRKRLVHIMKKRSTMLRYEDSHSREDISLDREKLFNLHLLKLPCKRTSLKNEIKYTKAL